MSTENTLPPVNYQRILENLNQVLLVFNADLQLEYINPAGEMLFAVSANRLVGQQADSLFPEGSHLLGAIHKGQGSGHPFTEHEVPCTMPGQKEIMIDFTITPLTERVGRSGLLLEIQQMDRQIRFSREEQQLSQQQTFRTLVRGLAHEIKNPLGGLRGAAQLLERELHDEELKEFTNIIIGEADRLQKLVDRMLGPNKMPNKEHINIHQVMEHVRQLVRVGMSKDIKIIPDYDPSIPEVLADRDQLIQAVLNIVGNAVRAIGSKGEIILSTRSERQCTIGHVHHKLVCRIDIIDNGPGIPEEMMESIFYPLVTGQADGTGLGLSIAQTLVNQHGGLILCESRPGRTKFSLLLPVDDGNDITQENNNQDNVTPLRVSA
ncbi:nitrogen regulation protein NR(II) [Kaarinaea lacus]